METLTVKACREMWLCVYWFVGKKSRQETKTDGYCARPMGETLTFGSAGCTHSLYYNSAYGTALVLNSSIEKLLASRDSSSSVERQSLLLLREEKSFFINGTWLAGFVNVIPVLSVFFCCCFFSFFLTASECIQSVLHLQHTQEDNILLLNMSRPEQTMCMYLMLISSCYFL